MDGGGIVRKIRVHHVNLGILWNLVLDSSAKCELCCKRDEQYSQFVGAWTISELFKEDQGVFHVYVFLISSFLFVLIPHKSWLQCSPRDCHASWNALSSYTINRCNTLHSTLDAPRGNACFKHTHVQDAMPNISHHHCAVRTYSCTAGEKSFLCLSCSVLYAVMEGWLGRRRYLQDGYPEHVPRAQ